MKNTIYCKTTKKGIQTFYLVKDNKEYFLFEQNYKYSVKEHFKYGLSINEATNYSNAKGLAVKRTLDKIKSYVAYIEKEYNIAVMNKTQDRQNEKKAYKRDRFDFRQYDYDCDYEYAY